MVCCGLPIGRGVEHHAPSIRLGNLGFSITLSLESHRHLRTSIIDSIVGEFAVILLTSSFAIHFSAISHIVKKLHILRRQPAIVKRYVCMFVSLNVTWCGMEWVTV
jgi:hypothetical protein